MLLQHWEGLLALQGEGHLLLGETRKFCDRSRGVNPKTYNVEFTPLPEEKNAYSYLHNISRRRAYQRRLRYNKTVLYVITAWVDDQSLPRLHKFHHYLLSNIIQPFAMKHDSTMV